jgi:ATP-dependent Lhr-like helicase
MRGRFTPAAGHEQWCDRHLLARIHRRTVQRLRREIEPVAPRQFMRFLIDWQHLSPHTRLRGPDALAAVLAQLEGFEAAAGAWESHVLPARVADYDIAWLDALCGAGRIAWTRLRAASGGHAAPVRASPIVLLPRTQLPAWRAVARNADAEAPQLSSRAQAVADFLAQHGASFFGEIAAGTRLLKVELEDALGELVGAGAVGADSFAGLRALLQPASKRRHARHRRLAQHMLSGIEDAGRWSLTRHAVTPLPERPHPNPPPQAEEGDKHAARVAAGNDGPAQMQEGDKHAEESDEHATFPFPRLRGKVPAGRMGAYPAHNTRHPNPPPHAAEGDKRSAHAGDARTARVGEADTIEHVARVLLRRWGVVFWQLLEREAAWLPPWRELRRVYQRLEARGEIRGGRFVEGISGEQFALPEAVATLRTLRKRELDGTLVCISGADPLNLVGGVLAGTKVPSLASSRIVYRDGVPVATRIAGAVVLSRELNAHEERAVRAALLPRRSALMPAHVDTTAVATEYL